MSAMKNLTKGFRMYHFCNVWSHQSISRKNLHDLLIDVLPKVDEKVCEINHQRVLDTKHSPDRNQWKISKIMSNT